MFEWLKGTCFFLNDEDCEIMGYNENENLLNAIEVNTNKEFNITSEEFAEIGSYFNHHFSSEDNWSEKLYNKLTETNKLHFFFWSTESGDSWDFKIIRKETKVTDEITIATYLTDFCGQVRGNIFSIQLDTESVDKFEKWLISQMEVEPLYNSDECYYVTLNGITMEESLMNEKEVKFICEALY
jgi:hypothetical protein